MRRSQKPSSVGSFGASGASTSMVVMIARMATANAASRSLFRGCPSETIWLDVLFETGLCLMEQTSDERLRKSACTQCMLAGAMKMCCQ